MSDAISCYSAFRTEQLHIIYVASIGTETYGMCLLLGTDMSGLYLEFGVGRPVKLI